MFIAGERVEGHVRMEVRNGLTGSVVGEIAVAQDAEIEHALAAAEAAAVAMRRLSAADRASALERAAVLVEGAVDELARSITLEEGKPIAEARSEAGRIPVILRLAAADLARPQGETLSVDAAPGAGDRLGLTLRQPCGVVLAITPFNYPLILVAHKVAPALAAGNAVILKPASHAALTALRFVELLLACGLPPGAVQCVTGPGDQVGMRLAADPRVRKVSFTGSTAVGEAITRVAGVKRLSLELGGNAPVVVLADADLEHAAKVIGVGGYINAGQACISPQRILVDGTVMDDFLAALVPSVSAIRVGDPLEPDTQLAGLVTQAEAVRVQSVIDEAVAGGARVLTGGQRDGAVVQPTVVADVSQAMTISREELFGPAVGVSPVDGLGEALARANDSPYGLSAAIFTRDLDSALRFARAADTGTIMINWHPLWRADLMPYGGLKMSGFGKEGPHYAIEEMTESKTVVFHGVPPA
jgi:acyl-CoA reductase-like NAD-dependent aldehyde dehydrogenase